MSKKITNFSQESKKYIHGQGKVAVGEKYGFLTAVKFIGIKNSLAVWRFKCDCGNNFRTLATYVRSGRTKSCGCYQIKSRVISNVKHGYFGTYTYNSWAAMIQRCTNPKNRKFYRYGGRGITVCERWLKFENFLADMGEKPGGGYSIERVDNDGNYEPSNCKWASTYEQSRNRSNNVFLHFRGKKYVLSDLSEKFGMEPTRLKHLIDKKVPLETIFANRDKKKISTGPTKPRVPILYNGKTYPLITFLKEHQIGYKYFKKYSGNGLSPEEIVRKKRNQKE